MYSLRDPEDVQVKELKSKAMQNPDKFVLKPLKEGGGNNFFGQEIIEML